MISGKKKTSLSLSCSLSLLLAFSLVFYLRGHSLKSRRTLEDRFLGQKEEKEFDPSHCTFMFIQHSSFSPVTYEYSLQNHKPRKCLHPRLVNRFDFLLLSVFLPHHLLHSAGANFFYALRDEIFCPN